MSNTNFTPGFLRDQISLVVRAASLPYDCTNYASEAIKNYPLALAKIEKLQAQLAEMREAVRWRIVAQEGNPAEDGEYLVYLKQSHYEIMATQHFCICLGWSSWEDVIAWMPKPAPPEVKNGNV
jgi:ABC-type ATPase with predicted acetyltransferase domain